MFTIHVGKIELDGVNHKSTSWKVSRDKDFTNLIVDLDKNEDYLDYLDINVPLTSSDIFYITYNFNYDDDSESGWQRPMIITKNSDGFITSDTIISTPKLFIGVDERSVPINGFKVSLSKFNLFLGIGKHKYTEFLIEDIYGNKVWERKETIKLNEIVVPSGLLYPNKLYTLKARFVSNNNAVSNYGKTVIKTEDVDLLDTPLPIDSSIHDYQIMSGNEEEIVRSPRNVSVRLHEKLKIYEYETLLSDQLETIVRLAIYDSL